MNGNYFYGNLYNFSDGVGFVFILMSTILPPPSIATYQPLSFTDKNDVSDINNPIDKDMGTSIVYARLCPLLVIFFFCFILLLFDRKHSVKC